MVSKDDAYKSWEKAFLQPRGLPQPQEPTGFVQAGSIAEPVVIGVVTTNSQHGQIITAPQMAQISSPIQEMPAPRVRKGWPKGKKRGS